MKGEVTKPLWVIVGPRLPRGRLLRGGLISCRCLRGSTFYITETCVELDSRFSPSARPNRHAKPKCLSKQRFGAFLFEAFFFEARPMSPLAGPTQNMRFRNSTHIPLDRPASTRSHRSSTHAGSAHKRVLFRGRVPRGRMHRRRLRWPGVRAKRGPKPGTQPGPNHLPPRFRASDKLKDKLLLVVGREVTKPKCLSKRGSAVRL